MEHIDPRRTAALFIDFQVDVCGRGGRMVSQESEVLARFQAARDGAARLLAHARDKRVFVVHVQHLFAPGYPELDGVRLTGMARYMMSQGAFVDGTEGAEIVAELQPAAGEVLLRKTSISAFETTDVQVQLQRRSIDTVIIAGVVSHYAVISAALSATDRGYRTVIAADACASADPSRHETALAILKPLAEVVAVDEIGAALG